MRKLAFHLVAILLLVVAGQAFAAEKLPKSLSTFRTSLKRAVLKGDHAEIATMMAPDFQWAMDTQKVSPTNALSLMDQLGLWQNFKRALVSGKVLKFSDSSCKGTCYAILASQNKENVSYIVKEVEGRWLWVEMRGD